MADNLERAAGSVTEESLQGLASDGKKSTVTQSQKLLKGLLDGVTLTDRILIQVLILYTRLQHATPCQLGSHMHRLSLLPSVLLPLPLRLPAVVTVAGSWHAGPAL